MSKTFEDFGIFIRSNVVGEVKTTCPQCSPSRKKKAVPCLSVNTQKGVWNCHHCGWSGGLGEGTIKISNLKPKFKPVEFKESPLSQKVLDWFSSRGITNEVLLNNKITEKKTWMPGINKEVTAILFPYFKDKKVVNVKYRDGSKNFKQESGAMKCLYNVDNIEDHTIIVEGEMDVLSCEVAGFTNVVSVPDGAPSAKSENFSSKFDFLDDPVLDKVENWIIAVDKDAPGKKLEDELCRRFGRDKCLIVSWPEGCKDANETLMKNGVESLKESIYNAKEIPIEGSFSLDDVSEELDYIFANGHPEGDSTGWDLVDEYYTVMPGQWTLVTGVPNHGKSEWLNALAVNMAKKNQWKFAICSTENPRIADHGMELIEKYAGKRREMMTGDEYFEAKSFVNESFRFVLPKEIDLDSVLSTAKYLVKSQGVKGLILDPFNEICHTFQPGVLGTEFISAFLAKLRAFAREQSIHIWLVAHPTKMYPNDEGKVRVPDGYDISGSAHFFNKSDAIISVYRERPRDAICPTQIHIQKMRTRWLGRKGMVQLWWDKDSGRYLEKSPEKALKVVG